MEDDLWRRTTFDGRQPLMEVDFDGRHPLMEDDIWWKTTFNGRQILTEDNLWQKNAFDRRQLLTEDNLWRNTTFYGRRPLMLNDLWQETTFDRRQPLMEDDLPSLCWSPYLGESPSSTENMKDAHCACFVLLLGFLSYTEVAWLQNKNTRSKVILFNWDIIF